jgi:hypothetical protein
MIAIEEKRSFPAGAVTLAVVHREFTEAAMLKYEGRPGVAELLHKIRVEGYYDKGVSVYVNETASGKDYLRFDCFEVEPHYHYHHLHDLQESGAAIEMDYQRIAGHAESVVMNGFWHQVPFDSAANGDIRDWMLDRLATRMPEMLREAGALALADQVELPRVRAALDELKPYLYAVPTP